MKKQNIEDRTNKTNVNYQGYSIKIIRYINAQNIYVEFQDCNKAVVHTQYVHFANGTVKNPYHPNVFGKGYIGVGKYKSKNNNKILTEYYTWHGMLERCFCQTYHQSKPTYSGCEISNEWYNFQNFAKWYEENIYTIDDETIELDKDILIKGNKIYSANTCVLVPKNINILFTKSNAKRGDYPIGVYFDKLSKKI